MADLDLEYGKHSLDNSRFVTNGGSDPMRYSPATAVCWVRHSDEDETEIDAWAYIVHTDQTRPVGGKLTAYAREGDELVGELRYFWLREDHSEIQFQDVNVEEGFRRRRVATALLRKLNLIHPEARINPGTRTWGGQAFMDHILKTEAAKVATNGILNVPLQRQIPPIFFNFPVPEAPDAPGA